MFRTLDRLRRGERLWAAELVLRGLGALLLGGTLWLVRQAQHMALAAPPHQPTPGEFAVCLAAVVLLAGGIALTLIGPGLFEPVPVPPRCAWYWKAG